MYIEDDILVPCAAINYWMKYNKKLIENKYNLGFVRIETNNKNQEFMTDVTKKIIKQSYWMMKNMLLMHFHIVHFGSITRMNLINMLKVNFMI